MAMMNKPDDAEAVRKHLTKNRETIFRGSNLPPILILKNQDHDVS
jgi:hypothetical protein